MSNELVNVEAQVGRDVIVTPVPEYGSKEWSDYVLSLLTPDEFFDKNPTCRGLRRVAGLLLGDIIVSRPAQVFPATDTDAPGRATVVWELHINWMNTNEIRIFGDVADVWHGNTDDLFCAHPVASAATKAEGRTYRKALCVNCVTSEEIASNKDVIGIVREKTGLKVKATTTGESNDNDPPTNAQLSFITTKCKQLNLNAVNLIGCTVKELTKKKASEVIAYITDMQNGTKPIPSNLGDYDPKWRE